MSSSIVQAGSHLHRPVPATDPELVEMLGLVQKAVPLVGLTTESIPQLRAAFAAMPTRAEVDPGDKFHLVERTATWTESGLHVPVVFAVPRSATGPAPVILYAHGGGMVAGHRWSNIGDLLELAATVGAAVVSVEYRLAPEYPYPAALDDCRTALMWLHHHAEELGVGGGIVLAGTSAGAGLMAALALLNRDEGRVPIAGQLLMAPMLDDSSTSFSATQMSGTGVWDDRSNRTGWTAYLGAIADDDRSRAVPACAPDLAGLPPFFLDVSDGETFRDEVVAYASRIWQAGGNAELHVWPGGFHGFDAMVPSATLSRDAKVARERWLHRALRRFDR